MCRFICSRFTCRHEEYDFYQIYGSFRRQMLRIEQFIEEHGVNTHRNLGIPFQTPRECDGQVRACNIVRCRNIPGPCSTCQQQALQRYREAYGFEQDEMIIAPGGVAWMRKQPDSQRNTLGVAFEAQGFFWQYSHVRAVFLPALNLLHQVGWQVVAHAGCELHGLSSPSISTYSSSSMTKLLYHHNSTSQSLCNTCRIVAGIHCAPCQLGTNLSTKKTHPQYIVQITIRTQPHIRVQPLTISSLMILTRICTDASRGFPG